MMTRVNPEFRFFTLDTGRLPKETHEIMDKLRKKYSMHLQVLCPDTKEVEEMVNTKGQNLFYESTENRILCCKVRKVNPINRILPTLDGWITGIRKEHSKNRNSMQMFQIDEQHGGILKINPIIDWSLEQIMEQIRERQIPYNALLDQNYSSIGCAPCTRAIKPGIFSPLDGFLGQADFESVISSGKLVNGTTWTIPIVLDLSSTDAAKAKNAGSVLLRGPDIAAVLDVAETFAYDKKKMSKGVFGTDDEKHPGVARVNQMADTLAVSLTFPPPSAGP